MPSVGEDYFSGNKWAHWGAAEGHDMVQMISSKVIDLSILEHEVAKLEDVNQAISGLGSRHGRFSNYVIVP